VVALGETVDEVAVGDRVCIEAHHGCGRCDNCLVGRYTACLHYGNAAKGHRATGMTADGGFAEYVLHHVRALYKMPPQVSYKGAVLLTTAGTVAASTRQRYMWYDIAILALVRGLMTVQPAKSWGLVASSQDTEQSSAMGFGADHIINMRERDPVAAIQDLTGGAGVDLSISARGC
jgi:L-iditol 2-dehydrogenase